MIQMSLRLFDVFNSELLFQRSSDSFCVLWRPRGFRFVDLLLCFILFFSLMFVFCLCQVHVFESWSQCLLFPVLFWCSVVTRVLGFRSTSPVSSSVISFSCPDLFPLLSLSAVYYCLSLSLSFVSCSRITVFLLLCGCFGRVIVLNCLCLICGGFVSCRSSSLKMLEFISVSRVLHLGPHPVCHTVFDKVTESRVLLIDLHLHLHYMLACSWQ